MGKLSLKLIGALVFVVIISVGLMIFLTNVSTESQFRQFLIQGEGHGMGQGGDSVQQAGFTEAQNEFLEQINLSLVLAGLAGAAALSGKLGAYAPPYIQFGVPALLMVALGLFAFWMVNRPKSADFLIATEGEMKKVSWSSKKEIIGSTKVVIIAVFMMAALLYVVDALFALLFRAMGVMGG